MISRCCVACGADVGIESRPDGLVNFSLVCRLNEPCAIVQAMLELGLRFDPVSRLWSRTIH